MFTELAQHDSHTLFSVTKGHRSVVPHREVIRFSVSVSEFVMIQRFFGTHYVLSCSYQCGLSTDGAYVCDDCPALSRPHPTWSLYLGCMGTTGLYGHRCTLRCTIVQCHVGAIHECLIYILYRVAVAPEVLLKLKHCWSSLFCNVIFSFSAVMFCELLLTTVCCFL